MGPFDAKRSAADLDGASLLNRAARRRAAKFPRPANRGDGRERISAAGPLAAFLVGTLGAGAAYAEDLTPTDTGFYSGVTGTHTASNTSYQTGKVAGTADLRGFITFDLPSGAPVTAATLRINSYNVINDPQVIDFYDVTTSVSTLRAGGTGLLGIFSDLGDGSTYATQTFIASNIFIDIPLSAAAVADINAQLGASFAIGFRNDTAIASPDGVFQASTFNAGNQLILTRADIVAPTLSITGPSATQTAPFTINFTFSEDVANFTLADIAAGSGETVSNLAGSGSAYTATVTPTADGLVEISVAVGAFEDNSANANTSAASYSVQADVTRPSVVVSGAPGPFNAPFTATFTFDEAVTNFTLGDIQTANGASSNFAGSGASYSATITPAADGAVSVSVPVDAALDAAGNTSTASNTFSVSADFTPPVITTPGDLTVNTDAGLATATVVYAVTASDPGNGALTPTLTSGLASGSAFPIGVNTVSYSVIDLAGNSASASFTITVGDNEAPTIVALPADITASTDAGLATAVVSWAAPTATDNAPGATITQTSGPASGSAFPIGVTTITYTAQDAAGNTTTQSFNVTVQDGEPPAFTNFPANITVNVDFPQTSALVNWTAPGFTDNTPGASVSQIAGPAAGSSFPLGNTTITYRVVDAAGNAVDQSFQVSVAQTPPGQVRLVVESGADGHFVFTSPETALNVSVTTVNGHGEVMVPIRPGTYAIAFAVPDGFGVTGADCDRPSSALNASSKAGSLVVTSGEAVTCTIHTVDSEGETTRLLGAFMSTRAALILQNQPDVDRRIDRLRGTDRAPGGVTAFGLNGLQGQTPFDISIGGNESRFSFSLASLRAREEAERRRDTRADRTRWGDESTSPDWTAANGVSFDGFGDPTNSISAEGASEARGGKGPAPEPRPNQQRYDLWVEGRYARFDTSLGDGDFYILHAGADVIAHQNLLLGFGVQFDWMESDGVGPSDGTVSGAGFMAGPYMTARLSERLFFDGQFAFGGSSNEVSPFGTYEDEVNAGRVFATSALIGDFEFGAWTFRPEGRVSYFQESTDPYIDGLGVPIPSIDVETGVAEFSPSVSYRVEFADTSVFEPYASVEGIWTFEQSNSAPLVLGSNDFMSEGVRGRVEGGFRYLTAGGVQFAASSFYDGFGSEDFSSWGAELRLSWSFDPH